jgi:hypothetical protein
MARKLEKYEDYGREAIHEIFSPETPFSRGAGSWGIRGIIEIPQRKNDFVFLVTYGQRTGDHNFEEYITENGVLRWQSQPSQTVRTDQIKKFLLHDCEKNSIYLFLRTDDTREYTYMGLLAYIPTQTVKDTQPVNILWQILDWELSENKANAMNLTLRSDFISDFNQGNENDVLTFTEPPYHNAAITTGRHYSPIKFDFAENERINKRKGHAGELLVVAHEKKTLIEGNREDLAEKIIHTSVIEGDGAGYDIKSYTLSGEEKFIEVKTTSMGGGTAFFITSKELSRSQDNANNYYLYRIYEFEERLNSGKCYILRGNLLNHLELIPNKFLAVIKNPNNHLG